MPVTQETDTHQVAYIDPQEEKLQLRYVIPPDNYCPQRDIVPLTSASAQEIAHNRLLVITPRREGSLSTPLVNNFLKNVVFYIRNQLVSFTGILEHLGKDEDGEDEACIRLMPWQEFVKNPQLAEKVGVPLIKLPSGIYIPKHWGVSQTAKHIFENDNQVLLVIEAIFQQTPNGARYWKWPDRPDPRAA